MSWSDKFRKLKIRTNSETPLDTKLARDFGMKELDYVEPNICFLMKKEFCPVREMILSKKQMMTELKALKKLLPHQKKDFIEIFKIMHGFPVTVRLLDPPLHEFLPKSENEIIEVSKLLGIDKKMLQI